MTPLVESTGKSSLTKVSIILNSNITDLNQNGVELLVLSSGSTRSRVLPVDIQTVKLILAQECDHAVDEGLTIG